MGIHKYYKRLQLIDYYIHKLTTGNLDAFARKMRISKSMLSEYIREMKEMGFSIDFCRQRNSYYYYEEGRMVDKLFDSVVRISEMSKLKGGRLHHSSWWIWCQREIC